jgi:hypothetical protein
MKILLLFLTIVTLGILNSVSIGNFTITTTVDNITSDLGKVGFSLSTINYSSCETLQGKEAQRINVESDIFLKNREVGDAIFSCCLSKKNTSNVNFYQNGVAPQYFLGFCKL